MLLENTAKALKELGNPVRLQIYRRLVQAGHTGLPVGELQKMLNIPHSTLSHHISALISVNLLQQQREGRTLRCVAQFEVLKNIIGFLMDECCIDENKKC